MSEKLIPFDAAEYIQNEEDARYFIEAAVDDDPGDGSHIRAALGVLARAGSMSRLARDAEIDRSVLYKALSPDRDPAFSTVLKIMEALGLRLRVEQHKTFREASK